MVALRRVGMSVFLVCGCGWWGGLEWGGGGRGGEGMRWGGWVPFCCRGNLLGL